MWRGTGAFGTGCHDAAPDDGSPAVNSHVLPQQHDPSKEAIRQATLVRYLLDEQPPFTEITAQAVIWRQALIPYLFAAGASSPYGCRPKVETVAMEGFVESPRLSRAAIAAPSSREAVSVLMTHGEAGTDNPARGKETTLSRRAKRRWSG
jgi:hypothetical protein